MQEAPPSPYPSLDLSVQRTFDRAARLLPSNGRIIGVDWGAKYIGVAVSDLEQRVASPREMLRRTKFSNDCRQIASYFADEREPTVALVFGLPLALSGSGASKAERSYRSIAARLAQQLDYPVLLWDERLSTAAAERTLIHAGLSRKRRGEVINQTAAAFFLQAALERLQCLRQQGARAAPT